MLLGRYGCCLICKNNLPMGKLSPFYENCYHKAAICYGTSMSQSLKSLTVGWKILRLLKRTVWIVAAIPISSKSCGLIITSMGKKSEIVWNFKDDNDAEKTTAAPSAGAVNLQEQHRRRSSCCSRCFYLQLQGNLERRRRHSLVQPWILLWPVWDAGLQDFMGLYRPLWP